MALLRSSLSAVLGKSQHTRRLASFKIPNPTWSLSDLKLTSPAGRVVSEEELQTLARKVLIDVDQISDTEGLRKDLANMMYCLEQVQNVNLPSGTAEEIYDAPRLLRKAPLRKATGATAEEVKEASEVWNSMLKPHTTKHGSHDYFSVVVGKKKDA